MKLALIAAAALLLPLTAQAQTPTLAAVNTQSQTELKCGFIIAKGSACALRNAERRAEKRAAAIHEARVRACDEVGAKAVDARCLTLIAANSLRLRFGLGPSSTPRDRMGERIPGAENGAPVYNPPNGQY